MHILSSMLRNLTLCQTKEPKLQEIKNYLNQPFSQVTCPTRREIEYLTLQIRQPLFEAHFQLVEKHLKNFIK